MATFQVLCFIFVCGLSYVLCDDPRIVITATDPPLNPISHMVVQQKDKDVQLTCSVETKPDKYDVIWTVLSNRPNASIVQVSTATRSHDAFRWAIDQPSTTAWRLRIQNVQVSDEGIYTCKVQVVSQNYIEDSRELRVVQTPRISDLATSSDMTKSYDMDAALECYASGRPTPLIKWTRMAGELLPNGGSEFQGNILQIDRVQSDHAGIYWCTALNSAGMDQREIRLTVLFKPEVHTSTRVAHQMVGYVKELVCNIKGYPPPAPEQITWMHEGMSVENTGRIEIRNIPGASNKITSILTIYGVREEDYGRYTCAAYNSKGNGQVTMSLIRTDTPTPDRSGMIRNAATLVSVQLTIFLMLLSVCVLHGVHWGR